MSAQTKGGLSKAYVINSIISVILMFSGWFLPTFGAITPMGMKVLGVFLGSVYAWCTVEFIWPSLLAMVVLGFTGFNTVGGVFSAAFSDTIVLGCLFTFVFIYTLDAAGVTKWIANWILTRKMCVGHPWILTLALFYASIIVAGFINLYGGILMLWAIFYNIAETFGFKKGDLYVPYMVTGMIAMSAMATMFLPFLPLVLIIFGVATKVVVGATIPFTPWLIMGLFVAVVFPILYCLVGKYILRLDLSGMTEVDAREFIKVEKLNSEQKFTFLTLAVFVLILVIPSVAPAGPVKAFFNSFGVIGAAVVCLVLACCRRSRTTGKKLTDFNLMAAKGLNWDIIIMFAATMPISAALESADCGILKTILGVLVPVFQQLGGVGFVIVTLIVLWGVTQFVHNLVLLIAVMPTLAGVCTGLGIDPLMYIFLLSIVLQAAMMTPGASAQAALVFGQTNWITSRDAVFTGTVVCVLALVFMICCYPLATVVFGLF